VISGVLLTLALAADFDVIVRSARVADGTGNPWFRADVGIKDGRVQAIGRLAGRTADREIDARGRILAPGFIDVHTQVEGRFDPPGLVALPQAPNFIRDGVTTVITGNCGNSRVDLARYFEEIERARPSINVSSFIGHNTVRTEVMGTANRQASGDELSRMQALVERGMREGAIGFSSGLIYVPGTYANTEEVVALAKAASRHGGVYASHIREERYGIFDAIEEAGRVGRESGLPVEISHFKIATSMTGQSAKTIGMVERLRSEGVDAVVDQYPYAAGSSRLTNLVPSWALAGGDDKVRERLRDPATRAKLTGEMLAKQKTLALKDYSYVKIAYWPVDRSLEGKSVTEVAKLQGKPETDTIFDLVIAGNPQSVFHAFSEPDVENILRYHNTAVASDAGIPSFGVGAPHPRGYATNSRVLSEYVRRRGVIRLEDAIRRMTSLPARTFGFRDRGLVREGYWADLVLFDPAKVEEKSTYENPHQYSEGFDFVLVNGIPVIENGRLTEARSGRVLRRTIQ
jgi:N-acyl-D-amino-acid deacylase